MCTLGNHYHVVLHTRQANLSLLMRHLDGVYTQTYNRRHGKVGHVFQGRFKAILVDLDNYLLELCRYVELNPVRAAMVPMAADYPWSSYLGTIEPPRLADLASRPASANLFGRRAVRGAHARPDGHLAHRRPRDSEAAAQHAKALAPVA